MPKVSSKQIETRKNEIIDACALLYKEMSFKDITIKEIGKITSFSRTSIYNYFQTKEEIFLALLGREYNDWVKQLEMMKQEKKQGSVDEFASLLAHTLEERPMLLKLLSMNHYDMEENSRMENLIEFKKAYGATMNELNNCLSYFFLDMSEEKKQSFIYSFFPFMFGIYPYTVVTDAQKEAMQQADLPYVYYSVYDLIYNFTKQLLK